MDLPEAKLSFPSGWTRTTVGEISSIIQYGYTASATSDKTGTRFLRITDIQNGTVHWDEIPCCEIRADLKPKYLLKKGDLVFARTGATVGKSYLIRDDGTDAVFASYLIRVSLFPEFDNRFVSYYFRSGDYWKQISESKLGIGQPNVNGTTLAKLFIPLPPLPEQHRIVAKIEELFSDLDAGVEALRKIKAELKRYRQAVLKAAVEGKLTEEWREKNKDKLEPASVLLERIRVERAKNGKAKKLPTIDTSGLPRLPEEWAWAKVEDVCDINMGQSPPGDSYNSDGKGIPLINGPVEFGPSAFSKTLKTKFTTSPTKLCKENDLILCVRGSTTGRMNIAGFDACIGRGVAALRALCNQNYLNIYVHSQQRTIFELGTGSTFPNVSSSDIANLGISVPPVAEQQQVVSEVERRFSAADEVERSVDAGLKQAERLRQSILKRAFEGKLVPQDPSDEPAEKLMERITFERGKKGSQKVKSKVRKRPSA